MSAARAGRTADGGFTLVELLVVIGLVGVLATAATSVILSAQRTQSFTHELRTVMDDGRLSLDRIRRELRSARRVLEDGSTETSIRFWLDRNQDGQMQADELICYAVSEIGGTGRFEILRWSGAAVDCDDVGSDAQSIARTLVLPEVFSYDPPPDDNPLAPRTRLVTVEMLLDVQTTRGPEAIRVETTLRLRNVR